MADHDPYAPTDPDRRSAFSIAAAGASPRDRLMLDALCRIEEQQAAMLRTLGTLVQALAEDEEQGEQQQERSLDTGRPVGGERDPLQPL